MVIKFTEEYAYALLNKGQKLYKQYVYNNHIFKHYKQTEKNKEKYAKMLTIIFLDDASMGNVFPNLLFYEFLTLFEGKTWLCEKSVIVSRGMSGWEAGNTNCNTWIDKAFSKELNKYFNNVYWADTRCLAGHQIHYMHCLNQPYDNPPLEVLAVTFVAEEARSKKLSDLHKVPELVRTGWQCSSGLSILF